MGRGAGRFDGWGLEVDLFFSFCLFLFFGFDLVNWCFYFGGLFGLFCMDMGQAFMVGGFS